MLNDQFPFSCDKLICCLIIQLSHVTNSYAAWSFSLLMCECEKKINSNPAWSFSLLMCECEKNKLRCCLIIQLTHVWVWEKTNSNAAWSFSLLMCECEKNKLRCCLIIQLTHTGMWVWENKLKCCLIIPFLMRQTHMLPDHLTFSCDSGKKINSDAAWSFSFLTWQTHLLPDHSAFSYDTHMLHDQFPFSHDKLICCLIIQLSHVTNSYAAWSNPILMRQTHMLPDHSAFSRDKLICCLIIQHSHVTKTIEFLFFENPHITHKSICLLTLHWVESICHWMVRWKYDHWHDLIQDVVKWYKYFTKTKKSPQISK